MKPTPFGRYLLLDKVASGGMAEVWRAKLIGEGSFSRIVAIKKILPHVCEDQEFITMFQDEANITVLLQHSNIGQVYEFQKIDDLFYIAMEYISGKDVKSLWSYQRSRKSTLPIELACYIVQGMGNGLDYAHNKRDNFGKELGIVHRDVSPQNALISWDGEVKVIDFGIAKAADKSGKTRAGALKGKFAYMAPEQIRGLPLDGRSDVFALGVCLYELLTGERCFQAESEFSLLEMVRNVEINPPTMLNAAIPPELERIVFKALAKNREHRYQTAGELSEDLQRFLLNNGKPPNRQALGRFMRENFTVEYDKERLRLESYREVQWEAPPPGAAPPVVEAPPPPSPSELAVAAAMAESSGWVPQAAGAFATPPTSSPSNSGGAPFSEPNDATGVRQATQTGMAPPMQRTQITTAGLDQRGGGAGKKVAIAATLFLLFAAVLGVGGFFLFRGSATVAITISNAKEAKVLLDNEEVGTANPSLALKVTTGSHSLIIQAPGYEMFTRSIQIDAGKVLPIKAKLMRAQGRVNVITRPAGAKIFLDGKDTGKTAPNLIGMSGGVNHSLSLQMENFKEYKESLKIDAGDERTVDLKLKPAKLKIRILSSPEGARVTLGGSFKGTTPFDLLYDADADYPKLNFSRKRCKSLSTTMPFERDQYEQKFSVSLECR
ncbi:MAG: protein kinase [Deltaproteobacteria bacterium]|nr:protein kinase [Deltaproteobacteria bacterium]